MLWVKRYWDIDVNPRENSYLDAAITQGYSLLTYDRLGTGQSDVPEDAYDIVQIPTEVEILAGLTQLARSGQLLSSSTILATNAVTNTTADSFTAANPPSKIIHIGHSLGSYITSGLLARHGDLSDGSVLTGYYLNSHLGLVNVSFFDHGFAAESAPARLSHYPSGYLLSTGPENMQKLYLRAGAFAPVMLDYADEVKQPEAVGTYASESVVFGPAMDFKGPLQVCMIGDFSRLTLSPYSTLGVVLSVVHDVDDCGGDGLLQSTNKLPPRNSSSPASTTSRPAAATAMASGAQSSSRYSSRARSIRPLTFSLILATRSRCTTMHLPASMSSLTT